MKISTARWKYNNYLKIVSKLFTRVTQSLKPRCHNIRSSNNQPSSHLLKSHQSLRFQPKIIFAITTSYHSSPISISLPDFDFRHTTHHHNIITMTMTIGQALYALLNNVFFLNQVHRMLALFANKGESERLRADLEEAQKKIITSKEKNSVLKARLTQ